MSERFSGVEAVLRAQVAAQDREIARLRGALRTARDVLGDLDRVLDVRVSHAYDVVVGALAEPNLSND